MTTSHSNVSGQSAKSPDPERAEVLLRLGDEISEMSAHLDAGTYQLLQLIGRFDQQGGWHGTGILSCAHWLNWRCGLNLGAAREQVRVARALPGLPQISAAFREGRVSYSKVRAMTRVATALNEDVLLDVALGGTASHVERQVSVYRNIKRSDALKLENLRHTQRELSWFEDDDGSWVFKGRFTPEQGALIRKALDAAMDQLFIEQKKVPEEVSAETSRSLPLDQAVPQGIASRRADALQRMAEAFLSSDTSQASSGDRYLVNIHTVVKTLKADNDGAGTGAESELEDGGCVSAETSRRLACDCSVVHWHKHPNGEPLNIGRKSRIVPPAIRRALHRRDGGCRFPGCTCSRFVDAHHIIHWADGGETSMENLVLLCRRHHRLVHEEGFGVEAGRSGAVNFTLPTGKDIPSCSESRFRGNFSELATRNRQLGLNITPKTPVPSWLGERMDYSIAVEGLLRRDLSHIT